MTWNEAYEQRYEYKWGCMLIHLGRSFYGLAYRERRFRRER